MPRRTAGCSATRAGDNQGPNRPNAPMPRHVCCGQSHCPSAASAASPSNAVAPPWLLHLPLPSSHSLQQGPCNRGSKLAPSAALLQRHRAASRELRLAAAPCSCALQSERLGGAGAMARALTKGTNRSPRRVSQRQEALRGLRPQAAELRSAQAPHPNPRAARARTRLVQSLVQSHRHVDCRAGRTVQGCRSGRRGGASRAPRSVRSPPQWISDARHSTLSA